MVTAETYPYLKCFYSYMYKKSISRKNTILPIKKLPSLVVHFPFCYQLIICLREVKNKRKFQTFSSKSDCGRLTRRGGRLQDKRLLVFWKTGRLKEVFATRGSTVDD